MNDDRDIKKSLEDYDLVIILKFNFFLMSLDFNCNLREISKYLRIDLERVRVS